jgi:hypothetical protein
MICVDQQMHTAAGSHSTAMDTTTISHCCRWQPALRHPPRVTLPAAVVLLHSKRSARCRSCQHLHGLPAPLPVPRQLRTQHLYLPCHGKMLPLYQQPRLRWRSAKQLQPHLLHAQTKQQAARQAVWRQRSRSLHRSCGCMTTAMRQSRLVQRSSAQPCPTWPAARQRAVMQLQSLVTISGTCHIRALCRAT